MSNDEITSLTLRLPAALRERIKRQAAREERTESQFVRFHLAQLLAAAPTSPVKPKQPAKAGR